MLTRVQGVMKVKRGVSVLAAGGLQGGLQGLPSEHLKRVCAQPEPAAASLPPTGAERSATTVNPRRPSG